MASCRNQNEIPLYKIQLDEFLTDSNSKASQLTAQFNDTLVKWKSMYSTRSKEFERNTIKPSRYVAFNGTRTKAILMVTLRDSSGHYGGVDYVKLISAVQTEKAWAFYFAHGNPNFTFDIMKYPLDSLEKWSWHTLMSDGLVNSKMEINEDYFDEKWFPENIEEYHSKWLKGEY
jgi:hypothetical protein